MKKILKFFRKPYFKFKILKPFLKINDMRYISKSYQRTKILNKSFLNFITSAHQELIPSKKIPISQKDNIDYEYEEFSNRNNQRDHSIKFAWGNHHNLFI